MWPTRPRILPTTCSMWRRVRKQGTTTATGSFTPSGLVFLASRAQSSELRVATIHPRWPRCINESLPASPRNHDQLLAVRGRRSREVAVLRFHLAPAQFQQVSQLPAPGPAQRHLARGGFQLHPIRGEFSVAPEIPADLRQIVETGSQDFADVAALRRRIGADQHRRSGVRIDQQIEARIEQMQHQSPLRRNVATDRRQRAALQIDCEEMLKRAEGYEYQTEAPPQV